MSELKDKLEKRQENAKGRVVMLTNTPFGFFDMEILQFFSQFGAVKRVRVPRSKKGNFKGIAYIYFTEPDVAKIAADSMHNYLMFEKRIKSRVLTDKIPVSILGGPKVIRENPIADRAKKEFAKNACVKKSKEEVEEFKERLAQSLDKSMEKLKAAGYKYKFEYRNKLRKA